MMKQLHIYIYVFIRAIRLYHACCNGLVQCQNHESVIAQMNLGSIPSHDSNRALQISNKLAFSSKTPHRKAWEAYLTGE